MTFKYLRYICAFLAMFLLFTGCASNNSDSQSNISGENGLSDETPTAAATDVQNSSLPTEVTTPAITETPTATETTTATATATATATETPKPTATEAPKPTATTEPISYEKTKYEISDNAGSFRILGRGTVTSNGITCDWTAAGIEFSANCAGTVRLQTTGNGGEAGIAYYTVYIDGVRQENRLSGSSANAVTLILGKNLEAGVHTFRILKQTYVKQARVTFKTLTINGKLIETAPAQKEHYIEFIGDSITCGHGILGSDGSAVNMDGTATFAFNAAEKLGADFSMICIDGIGIVKGYQPEIIGDVYEYTCKYRSSKTKYDFARKPDIVVINLGTNDATFASNSNTFKQKVTDLINTVRDKNGNVPVIWVYNSMRADYREHAKAAIDALGGESAGLYMVEFVANASGGNGHPSAASHISNGNLLADYIKAKGFLK